jgi:modulator of FtsH protease
MGGWTDFFAAQVGAAAALAGLVIVGISINVTRILSAPGLTGRAAETLVTPTGLLIACSFSLVPHQPDWLLGGELVTTGLAMFLVPAIIQIGAHRSGAGQIGPAAGIPRGLLVLFSSVPFLIAGMLLFQHASGALYWTVPGVVASLIATVINAWVLLIEILR